MSSPKAVWPVPASVRLWVSTVDTQTSSFFFFFLLPVEKVDSRGSTTAQSDSRIENRCREGRWMPFVVVAHEGVE